MTPSELQAAGFNVELNYKPYIPAEELLDLQEQVTSRSPFHESDNYQI
jgi:hypothetical protein